MLELSARCRGSRRSSLVPADQVMLERNKQNIRCTHAHTRPSPLPYRSTLYAYPIGGVNLYL